MFERIKNKSTALTIGVLIFCLLIVAFVSAWTGPPGIPPDSNAPAPINISSSGQEKEGQLGIAIPSGESLDGSYGLTVGTASNPLGIKTSGDSYFESAFTLFEGVTIDDAASGKNLIPNWQMESDTYWSDGPEQASVADFNGVNHYAHRSDETDTGCYNWAHTVLIPADANKLYKFSIWIKCDDSTMNNYLGFHIYDSNKTRIIGDWSNPYFKSSQGDANSWKKWTAYLGPSYSGGATGCDSGKTNGNDWCMAANTAYIKMRFGACYGDGGSNGYSWFMYPKIEEIDPDDSYFVGNTVFMDGNVGIGTITPGYALDVSGQVNATELCIADDCQSSWVGVGGGGGWVDDGAAVRLETASDNVGIGTASVDANYKITTLNGGIKADANIFGQPAGYFSNSDAGGYSLIADSGNVGIGTTNPDVKLHINSNSASLQNLLKLRNEDQTTGSSAVGILFSTGGIIDKGLIAFEKSGTASRGNLIFATDASISGGGVDLSDADMTIDLYGNVGIGNSAPDYKLDVLGQANATELCIADDCQSSWANVITNKGLQRDGSNNFGMIDCADNQVLKYDFALGQWGCAADDTGAGGVTGSGTDNYLAKWTGASSLGVSSIYDDSGNVGIGDTTPSYKLDVAGNIGLTGTHLVYDSTSGVIDWGSAGSGNLYFRTLSTQGDINTYTDRMTVLNNGNVGIGTTSPGQKLQVAGNIVMQSGGYLDDDSTVGEHNDDWIGLKGYIEMKSNTDSYGIVLRNKDASDYLGITQVNGYSYLTDSSSYSNYFLRGGGANVHVRGGITMGAQTRYYSIAPTDFTITKPSTDWHTISYAYARADMVGISFVAPVHLPHGAVVTVAVLEGNSAAAAETWYLRRLHKELGTWETMATARVDSRDYSISYTTIDNLTYAYSFVTSSLDTNDKLFGGFVGYTITSPYP